MVCISNVRRQIRTAVQNFIKTDETHNVLNNRRDKKRKRRVNSFICYINYFGKVGVSKEKKLLKTKGSLS